MEPERTDALLRLIEERAAAKPRFVIALSGPPGAGKSTLAQSLAQQLENGCSLEADAFHYDNGLLDDMGLKHRKGAPETFDVQGFIALLARLGQGGDLVVPVFDRKLDLVRGSAKLLPASARFVVVEGNYLALREGPWAQARQFFDLLVYIDVEEAELRRRLTRRWRDLGCSEKEIADHVEGNDLPNMRYVAAKSAEVDFILRA